VEFLYTFFRPSAIWQESNLRTCDSGLTMTCVPPCFVYPHTHITSDIQYVSGIPSKYGGRVLSIAT
jgi:hypothetical protein